MTTADLKPHLTKCKKMVLAGMTADQIAGRLGIAKRTVYNYLKQLVYLGELIIVGDEKATPRLYEDGKRAEEPYN